MPLPLDVLRLIERFEAQRETYVSGRYNETQLRVEFVNPLFEALGWDVLNRAGEAEAFKDVIHEDKVKIGGWLKAPDYAFRLDGKRQFFVETKNPSVQLKTNAEAAYQIRRYAWSAKLPISVLTDFEEIVVYDTRVMPSKDDRPARARLKYIHLSELKQRWDEIESLLSKDAVRNGSLAAIHKQGRRGRDVVEVDDAFLMDIERWRGWLAQDLDRNNSLTVRQLNAAVQSTIDRLIFLRICEGRGIETYSRLLALTNGNQIYARLLRLYDEADHKYNSGLFHFRQEKGRVESPDRLTHTLKIGDDTLRNIIKQLYFPDSPYEFSILPADILGQVYERFLGACPSNVARVRARR